jgi:poly(hydroxyalkanoate) depolymerase family esterase
MTATAGDRTASRLIEIADFGTNPGNLRMYLHHPTSARSDAGLVLALPGCWQTAADYTRAGWSTLADKHGLFVVYAQQRRRNNAGRCFNWFSVGDQSRHTGEPLSLRQMVDYVIERHPVDPTRVVVTGTSAGGAMAVILLAVFPDVFAGGAIMSGAPYRSATTVFQAHAVMNGGVSRGPGAWGDLVRAASPGYPGPWPRVSLWHGEHDTQLHPNNLNELAKQWTDVHGVRGEPSLVETVRGHQRQVYTDATGRPIIETWLLADMGHGTPINPGPRVDQGGVRSDYFFDADVHSTYYAARFLELLR